jgi:hypothetical protein
MKTKQKSSLHRKEQTYNLLLIDCLLCPFLPCAEFVYLGEVSVSQTMLQSFLKTAGLLRIRGLADDTEDAVPADIYSKRSRKPSKEKEEIVRKRKAAAPGSEHGGGLEPSAAVAKLHCGAGAPFSGGVKNGGPAELLAAAAGSGGGGNEELMLKQEPLDPGAHGIIHIKAVLRIRIRDTVLFYPPDPGSGMEQWSDPDPG